jgi:hypothetical protein
MSAKSRGSVTARGALRSARESLYFTCRSSVWHHVIMSHSEIDSRPGEARAEGDRATVSESTLRISSGV